MFPQCLAVSDDVLWPHCFFITSTTHIETSSNPAFQARLIPDLLGQSPSLIGSQGIHGIQNDRFDSRLSGHAETVIQHGVKKTLGFA